MEVQDNNVASNAKGFKRIIREWFGEVPLIGWLFGILVAVILEQLIGDPLSEILYLPKIPVLFGCVIMLKKPLLAPSALAYVMLVYVVPMGVIGRLTARPFNALADKLLRFSLPLSVLIHLVLIAAFHSYSSNRAICG